MTTARQAASEALSSAASVFPLLPAAPVDFTHLASQGDARESRLALAIYRTAIQRWLTLEHVLNLYLRQPLQRTEPVMQGILLAGAAQLVFMPRLPAYAVVDESVELAGQWLRPGARGLVNAVLRRVAELISETQPEITWQPAADLLPAEAGRLRLREPVLPDPAEDLAQSLSIACSHPLPMVQRWLERFGRERTQAMLVHDCATPPLIVAVEPGFSCSDTVASDSAGKDVAAAGAEFPRCQPHAQPGFILFDGSHDELLKVLAGHDQRRVQDPASSLAVRASAALAPKVIVDYCAGRGTKTLQLSQQHPQARVIATEVDADRLRDLKKQFAGSDRVLTGLVSDLAGMLGSSKADLLLLDVPCSNSAVLARRPEARYRHSNTATKKLVALQRQIVRQASQHLAPGGHLLYSTCSLDQEENQQQTRWMLEQFPGCELISEGSILPEGIGSGYHDGSYHSLLRWKA